MTITENIYAAKTNFSKLVDRALRGDEVIIAKAGKPLVCLVPYTQLHPAERMPGTAKGLFSMTDDFEAPLPESEVGEWER
jgi:prevent-host-death family protein